MGGFFLHHGEVTAWWLLLPEARALKTRLRGQRRKPISSKRVTDWELLAQAGGGGLRLLQQLAGLGDEFCDFEGLYQVGNAAFLQEGFFVAGSVGEGEQDVTFHRRAVLSKPLVGLFGAPLAGELSVHDEGVKGFGEQASLHILAGLGRHDAGAGAGQHVALKFEHRFFFFDQQDAAVDGALVQAGSRFRRFGLDLG